MLAHNVLALESYAPPVQTGRELQEADIPAALALLAERPLQGVHLRSLLLDNGLGHLANRGRFFGYFADGVLVGLALLGHATMLYARPAVEAAALAFFAQQMLAENINSNVVFGPRAQVESLGAHLAAAGRSTKMVRDFSWYVCRQPRLSPHALQLQRANLTELEPVAAAHADLFQEQTGSDPRVTDPSGFQRRVAERIERQRTWIKLTEGEVVFKSELQSVTPEAVYLEGVWTRADQRAQGIAKQCLTELTSRLLRQHQAVCLAAGIAEESACRLYEQVGFVATETYQARYLQSH